MLSERLGSRMLMHMIMGAMLCMFLREDFSNVDNPPLMLTCALLLSLVGIVHHYYEDKKNTIVYKLLSVYFVMGIAAFLGKGLGLYFGLTPCTWPAMLLGFICGILNYFILPSHEEIQPEVIQKPEIDQIKEILTRIPGFQLIKCYSNEIAHYFHFTPENEESLKVLLRLANKHNFQTHIYLGGEKFTYNFVINKDGGADTLIEENK